MKDRQLHPTPKADLYARAAKSILESLSILKSLGYMDGDATYDELGKAYTSLMEEWSHQNKITGEAQPGNLEEV